jgi:type I restriction enzyme M protein
MNHLRDIEKLEADLWKTADDLRANAHKSSSEYCMPVLGVIFPRHATNRYDAACREIAKDQAAGKMPRRPLNKADFLKRRALMLPKEARYDELMRLPKGEDFGAALVAAMNAIEREFEPLHNQLPKDYGEFEPSVLENLPHLRQRYSAHRRRRRFRTHLRILPHEVRHAGRAG